MTAGRVMNGLPPSGPFSPSSPGAGAAVRFVGGTTAGAPTIGTFAVGDFVVDRSGAMWICVAAGTPGTWIDTSKTEVAFKTDATNFQWITGTDTGYKVIPGLTDTSILLPRPHHVYVGAWMQSTVAIGVAALAVHVDGVLADYIPCRLHATANTPQWLGGMCRVAAPVAGQHTIDVRLNNFTAGTVQLTGTVNPSKMIVTRG